MKKEYWKPVIGFEGLYEVSNFGRVKSLPRKNTKGRILKPRTTNCGYLQVDLCKCGKIYHKTVHRLVAEAFIDNPNNLPQVNHKDENKESNFVWVNDDGSVDESKSNLEYCDAKYNANYGSKNDKMKKQINQFLLDGITLVNTWSSTREIERKLGFCHSAISECCSKKRFHIHAYGFIWRYKNEE